MRGQWGGCGSERSWEGGGYRKGARKKGGTTKNKNETRGGARVNASYSSDEMSNNILLSEYMRMSPHSFHNNYLPFSQPNGDDLSMVYM